MANIYGTADAGRELGCSARTVLRHAQRLGLGTTIGGGLALTAGDLARIRQQIGPVGNPKMIAGNQLWRLRKKVKNSSKSSR